MPVLGTIQEGLHPAIERSDARRDGMVSLCMCAKCMHNVMREHMRMDVDRLGYLQSIS